jgi:vacuolar-type H+-ATPase subunit D/Vma8
LSKASYEEVVASPLRAKSITISKELARTAKAIRLTRDTVNLLNANRLPTPTTPAPTIEFEISDAED